MTSGVRDLAEYCELLNGVHVDIRHALEDSIRCLNPRARYFHHVEEPEDLPKKVQIMMMEVQTLTRSQFKGHIFEVISSAIYEVCKLLHEREAEMFSSTESAHRFLDDTQHTVEGLQRQADQAKEITQRVWNFHRDLNNMMKLTKDQKALYNIHEEPSLEKFVQDSVDMAFREDPRDLLTSQSATVYLEGVQGAAIKRVFGTFDEALNIRLRSAMALWLEKFPRVFKLAANKE